jgi:DNA-binding PadR family transcriptional regulator
MVGDLSQRSILVLTSLADGPKHGYALIKDIEQFAGVALGPGTLYGALARLEDAGHVKALPAQKRRHPYQITAAGTAALIDQLRRDEQITRVGLARIGVQPV